MTVLRVKDLMSDQFETVPPHAHLRDALIKMNRAGFRHLPVVTDNRLVGIITDRDVRLAVNSPVIKEDADLSREKVLDQIRVDGCMTPEPQFVTSATPLREAADILVLTKFGALPVVDDGKLVGIISYIDFLKHYAAERSG